MFVRTGGRLGHGVRPKWSHHLFERVSGEGSRAEILVTSIDGVTLDSPNDLVFSADGSPYITGRGRTVLPTPTCLSCSCFVPTDWVAPRRPGGADVA